MTKRTPLHDIHVSARARMVDYESWDMPVLFTGILEEARAVRHNVGIFDISHMGRVRFIGPMAGEFLQTATSNNVLALRPGQAHYSLLTNPQGGITDDLIIYRQSNEAFLVVMNAGNTDKDLNWLASNLANGVSVQNDTESTAMIAVQGPAAPALVATLAGDRGLLEVQRFHHIAGCLAGVECVFCRTGYTGEDGFEIIAPAEGAPAVWESLIQAGATPCGLGSRDVLRIEAGYPLYGHEINETTSPVDAGLMWVVDRTKAEFCGSAAIERCFEQGPERRLMGVLSTDRTAPRQGYPIYAGEETIGEVTSGVFSPARGCSLGMAYIATEHAKAGSAVEIGVRGRRIPATQVLKKHLLKHTP